MPKWNLEPYIDRTVYVHLNVGAIYYGVLRTDNGKDFMVYNHKDKFLSTPFYREDILNIGYEEKDVR